MGWFYDRRQTVMAALTLRRALVVPLIFTVVTAVVRFVPEIASWNAAMLLGVPAPAWGAIAAILLLLWFMTEYATRLRKQIRGRRTELSILRGEGVKIRNDGILAFSTEAEMGAWVAKTLNWNKRVIDEIALVNEADSIWFSVLDDVHSPRVPMKVEPPAPVWLERQAKAYREHDERLKRLGDMIRNLWRDD